jgi:hypothetical protein
LMPGGCRLGSALSAAGDGAAEAASSRVAQLMRMWHECSRCQLPTSVIAAAAQRIVLARARCIRVDSANGIVDVYSAACSEAPTTPGVWKAVSTVDAADQERWHRLLDFCAH